MTGFIRGLFGKGKKSEAQVPPKPAKQEKAFFLDSDQAKTFGDIDYMRSAKTVKRTFAKKKGSIGELESIRQISALSSVDFAENGQPVVKVPQVGKPQPQMTTEMITQSAQPQRRQPDDSMDMFRNMARNLKKK
ncbi:hypothetical protein [Almyronema epifaneia]|uniref:Uncharacterized protein n=1 Tax=Almyronema epifaneia S1 TaxID=2991925 RepID=A0ABW6IAK5_9CYAN